MPRRMIESDIWFNEKVGNLPLPGRLLFIGIFSNADDDGRLLASPKYLKAQVFPYDEDITYQQVKEWRELCVKASLFFVYANNGREYLQIPGWAKHQAIRADRYKPSKHPAPPDEVLQAFPITLNYQVPKQGSEKYEYSVMHTLAKMLEFNQWQPTNEKIRQVEINKRLGNLYADIVARTDHDNYLLLEIKAYPLQPKDLGQIIGYRKEMEKRELTPITAILIGNGLGNLSEEEAAEASVGIEDIRLLLPTNTTNPVGGTQDSHVPPTDNHVNPTVTPTADADKGRGGEDRLDKDRIDRNNSSGKVIPTLSSITPTTTTIFNILISKYKYGFGREPDSRDRARLHDLAKEIKPLNVTEKQIHDAFGEAATHNKLNLSYVRAILLAWLQAEAKTP